MIKAVRALEQNFSITKAAGIVGFFTLFAKFLALFREWLFATMFGQGKILDTYFAAFRIPDFVTGLFVMSTLSVAFLPIFTAALTKNRERANYVANIVFNCMMAGMALVCVLLLVLSEPLTRRLVPGFDEEYFRHALNLTRLFLLSPLLFTASTLFGGILNSHKKFLIASFAPILYNVGIIAGVLWLYPRFGIMGLGYGVIAGAVLQVAIQQIAAMREGYSWRPAFNLREPEIAQMSRMYVPRILAFDLANITLLLGTIIGSQLEEGTIASLNQAFNLQSVAIGVFAYSLAVAVFPVLSEHFAKGDEESYLSTLAQTTKQTLFFMIPISILILVLRAHTVRVTLGYGNFTWEDTVRTFQALGIFSFSLFSQSLTTLFSRAFFARQNTKVPVAINLTALFANAILTLLLGPRFGIVGIVSAFVMASVLNACLLFIVLRHELSRRVSHEEISKFDNGLFDSILKISLASIAGGFAAYGARYAIDPFLNTQLVYGIVAQAAVAAIVGVAAYLVVGKMFKLREAQYMLDFVGKIWYSNR